LSVFDLTGGSPAGGKYYVDSVLSLVFDPAGLGLGIHEVVYKKSNNDCFGYDTVEVLVDICSGVSQLDEDLLFEVFPNPASDALFFVAGTTGQEFTISLFNSLEELVGEFSSTQSNSRLSIDVGALPRGIYWIVVENGTHRHMRKVILQ